MNGSYDFFGLHTVDCAYHPFGACSLAEVEKDFQQQWGDWSQFHSLMDNNAGLWIHDLDPLLAAWERDKFRFSSFLVSWQVSGHFTPF